MANFNDFHYAMFLANSLYNLTILPDNFEEVGLVAFNLIGNKRQRIYKACLEVQCPSRTV
jgi:hypothetical protein